jgi:hemerythrin
MKFMQPWHWTAEIGTFQPEFDAEHRELMRLCDDLNHAVQAADTQQIQEILRHLAAELASHFAHEERLMRQKRLDGYDWHKQQHDHARRRLHTLSKTAPGDVPSFLANWVRDHASVADRIMASRLRNADRIESGCGAHALTATKKVRPSPKLPDMPRSSAS